MRNLLIPLLYICVGALLGMMLMRSCKPKEITTEIIKTDTLTIVKVDTNRYDKPKPISEIITGIDVSFQPYAFFDVENSSGINLNSLNLNLNSPDIEQYNRWVKGQGQTFYHTIKLYQDSTYTAQVSGINANLDFIEVYPRTITKYITNTEKEVQKPKKWGLVASAEYGYMGGRSYLPVGVKLRYTDNRRTYFVKGGKDVVSGMDFVAAGAELDILRW